MPGLAAYVKSKFEDAENGRYATSSDGCKRTKTFVASMILRPPNTVTRSGLRSSSRSQRRKSLQRTARLLTSLFANKKFPLVVESTPVPEGIAEFAHMETPLDDMISNSSKTPTVSRETVESLCPVPYRPKSQSLSRGVQGERRADLPLGQSPMGEPQIEPAKNRQHLTWRKLSTINFSTRTL